MKTQTAPWMLGLCLAVGPGCKMDNPAFGETGESGTGTSTSGDDTKASDDSGEGSSDSGDGDGSTVDTGDGDAGDGDSGDGDGDTGDGDTGDGDTGDGDGGDGDGDTGDGDAGDGDSGDGDGDTGIGDGDGDGETCETLLFDAFNDTFLMDGPSGADNGYGCMVEEGIFTSFSQPCNYLNFGASPDAWIGSQEGDAAANSIYLVRFDVEEIAAQAETWSNINSVGLRLHVDALEGAAAYATLYAQAMTPGDMGHWIEGNWHGQMPETSDESTTYAYQYWSSTAWPDSNPYPPVYVPLGSNSLSGQTGEQLVLMGIDPGTFLNWVAIGLADSFGNGLIIESDAPPYTMHLAAREAGTATVAQLYVDVCYANSGG